MRNKKENDDVRNCACYMDIGVYNRSQCRVRKPARIHFIYIYIYRKKRKADFSAFRLVRVAIQHLLKTIVVQFVFEVIG